MFSDVSDIHRYAVLNYTTAAGPSNPHNHYSESDSTSVSFSSSLALSGFGVSTFLAGLPRFFGGPPAASFGFLPRLFGGSSEVPPVAVVVAIVVVLSLGFRPRLAPVVGVAAGDGSAPFVWRSRRF